MTNASELYGKPWGEREYIIALRYYFEHRDEPQHLNSPFVREAAELLGRTPGSIMMRMANFASLDSDGKTGQGLVHIGPAGYRAFMQWRNRQDALREVAEVLIREHRSENVPTLFEPLPIRMPRAFGGKYDPLDCLGEGGFGAVVSVVNVEDNQPYALKIIKADRVRDRQCLHRFRQEIRALKCIDHPSVIRIHEENLAQQEELPAFVMDLAERSLTALFQERSDAGDRAKPFLAEDEARRVFLAMLDATEALHGDTRRIIHRDINPNNVLQMPDGQWVLADFGLVGFLSTVPTSTTYQTTGAGLGTIPYGAPEQYRSFQDTDERTDVYALGVLLWELYSREYGTPDRAAHGLPEPVAVVFLRATNREKRLRYQDIGELRTAFLAAVGGLRQDHG